MVTAVISLRHAFSFLLAGGLTYSSGTVRLRASVMLRKQQQCEITIMGQCQHLSNLGLSFANCTRHIFQIKKQTVLVDTYLSRINVLSNAFLIVLAECGNVEVALLE